MEEKIVVAMPKVSINSISEDEQVEFGIYPHAVEIIVEAQCQLLAKQGYRPVPSLDEIDRKLVTLLDKDIPLSTSKQLHRWLLEGEGG